MFGEFSRVLVAAAFVSVKQKKGFPLPLFDDVQLVVEVSARCPSACFSRDLQRLGFQVANGKNARPARKKPESAVERCGKQKEKRRKVVAYALLPQGLTFKLFFGWFSH